MKSYTNLTEDDRRRLFCVARNCASALRFTVEYQAQAGYDDGLHDAEECLVEALSMMKDSGYISQRQRDRLLGYEEPESEVESK